MKYLDRTSRNQTTMKTKDFSLKRLTNEHIDRTRLSRFVRLTDWTWTGLTGQIISVSD